MTWQNPPPLQPIPPELMTDQIIVSSRQDAIRDGFTTYFTGEACLHGHIDERYVSSNDCKTCHRLKSRAYGRKNIKKIVNRFKTRVYGIAPDQFEKMLELQNNKCLLCEEIFNTTNNAHKGPHLDHNHKTGNVRGILCRNCNTGLGLFKDDVTRLQKGINYLRKYDGME